MDPLTQAERDALRKKITQACRVTGMAECWVPSGKGFDVNRSGYTRTNFHRRKILCHLAMWCLANGKEVARQDGDISHLCNNPGCCNPNHLCLEGHQENLDRRHCPGYFYFRDDPTVAWKACTHDPPCLVFHEVDRRSLIRLRARK